MALQSASFRKRLSIPEILIQKNWKVGTTMINCQNSRFCSGLKRLQQISGMHQLCLWEECVHVFLRCGFSKSMSCNTSMLIVTLVWSVSNIFLGKKFFHVEGITILKANLKCSCRFTQFLNLDTVHAMSRTNRELQIQNEFEYENDFKQCLLIIKKKTSQLKEVTICKSYYVSELTH